MVVRNDETLRQRKGKGTPASEDVCMSRWNLCVSLLSPTADGEEKCSEWHKVGVPGEARGKTREKMRENGGLWMKNGEL